MWLQFRADFAGRYIEMCMCRVHMSMHTESTTAFQLKRIRRCSVDGRKRYENDKCGRKPFWKRRKRVPFSFENGLVWTGAQWVRVIFKPRSDIQCAYIEFYYSTNCNTIQIWSWCSRYLSSVGNVYPAIYVASYVGRKSEVKKCRQKDLKMLRVLLSICWIIKQLSCSISRNIVWF